MSRLIDHILEVMKRWEAKYYHADYAKLRSEHLALQGDQKRVRALPVLGRDELRTVLIFKPDEIGDCLYSLPALKLLRAALPQARFFLVCQKKTAPIFERTGLVDEIATINVKTTFRKFNRFSVPETLRKFTAAEFDVGIFLRSYPGYFRQFLKFPCRIQIHPRDPRMKSKSVVQPFVSLWTEPRQHQAVQMTEIVEPLTATKVSRDQIQFPTFQFSDSDRAGAKQLFERKPESFIVVHPFADFETRQYVYWNEVLRWMKDRFRVPIVVVGGPRDPLLPLPNDILQTQGKFNLGQTAFLISQSDVFLGNLSGPVHLAGALGVPNVTMMSGHSAPVEWAPFGDSLVLRADVGCAPCHLRSCTTYQLACVRSLNPLKIMPHLEAFLSSRLGKRGTRPKPDTTTEVIF